MSASTIINDSLAKISKHCSFKPFDSATKYVKATLEELYPVCCDDATYIEMCKVYLTMAFSVCENEQREFDVIRYRNTITIHFANRDLLRDPVMSLVYDYVFERPRESWDRHFMRSAHQAASRTTCRAGRAVGAQFVRNNVPLVRGYNGVPSKFPHPKSCKRIDMGCKTGEGLHLCPCNHAETNAIAMAAGNGINLQGSTLYVTSRPCPQCMGALSVVKPARIIYDDPYDGADEVSNIALNAGIELIRLVDIT